MGGDLEVNASVMIPDQELLVRVCRASGPGGQHVNTSNTKVQLLWSPATSVGLSDLQRERVIGKLSARLTKEGVLICSAEAHRSQARNLEEARERLAQLVRQALFVPKARKATKPSRGQKAKRLKAKKERGQIKAQRQQKGGWD